MNNPSLYLSEIYSALQGEGPLVGIRQIFVRLSGCDLRCVWCDTPNSLIKTEYCEVEEYTSLRQFKKIKNPVSGNDFIDLFSRLNPKLHHSVSFTGGEPLLQATTLLDIIPEIKNKFLLPIYLETGGHRPDKLKEIIHLIDYISMDFKLPSSSGTQSIWEEHKEFLSISFKSKNLKDFWVKIVITNQTDFSDLLTAVNLINKFKSDKNVEVILQPVTEINGIKAPDQNELLNINSRLLEYYTNIRVLPQVHKLIGQK